MTDPFDFQSPLATQPRPQQPGGFTLDDLLNPVTARALVSPMPYSRAIYTPGVSPGSGAPSLDRFRGVGKTQLELAPISGEVRQPGEVAQPTQYAAPPAPPPMSGLSAFGQGIIDQFTFLPDDIRQHFKNGWDLVAKVPDFALGIIGNLPTVPVPAGLPLTTDTSGLFARLPETTEKQRAEKAAQSDPANALWYMGEYLRLNEEEIAHGLGVSPLVSDFFVPSNNLGDQIMRAFGAFGIPGRLVERAFADSKLRDVDAAVLNGDPETMNPALLAIRQKFESGEINHTELLDMMAKEGFGFSNNPYENMVWEIFTDPLNLVFAAGVAERIANSGARAAHIAGTIRLARDGRFGESFVNSMDDFARNAVKERYASQGTTLDDAKALSIARDSDRFHWLQNQPGGPELSDLALTGMTARERAVVALDPVISKVARISRAINSPFDLFGAVANKGKFRNGERIAAFSSRATAEGLLNAYDPSEYLRLDKLAQKFGPAATERLTQALGRASANIEVAVQRDAITRMAVAAGSLPAYLPDRIIEKMSEVFSNRLALQAEGYVRRIKTQFLPTARMGKEGFDAEMAQVRRTAGQNLQKLLGPTADAAEIARYVKALDPDALALIEHLHYGWLLGDFHEARRLGREQLAQKAADEQAKAGKMVGTKTKPRQEQRAAKAEVRKVLGERYTVIGPRELTYQRAKRVLADVKAGRVENVREAVEKYDMLYENFAAKGLADKELLEQAGTMITTLMGKGDKGSALVRTLDRATLPPALRDWHDAAKDAAHRAGKDGHDAYQVGIAPQPSLVDRWRGVYDSEGKLTAANPWVDIVPEVADTHYASHLNSLSVIRNKLFRPIRGERLLEEARRTFRQRAVVDYELSRSEANELFGAIRQRAGEANTMPRGLTASELGEMLNSMKLSDATKQRIGVRGMARLVAMAFEGSLMTVGITQKITGKMKTATSKWGNNWLGVVAERLYPMLRFTYNPIFVMQEAVEPFFWNLLHGIRPGVHWRPEDVRMFEGMRRSGIIGDWADQWEYSPAALLGIGQAEARRVAGPGTLIGRLWGDYIGAGRRVTSLAELKRLNYVRQVRRENGRVFQHMVEQVNPSLWDTFVREAGTADPQRIAEWYWLNKGFNNPDNPHAQLFLMDATAPSAMGHMARINTSELARLHHFIDSKSLRKAIAGGSYTESDFRKVMDTLKADPGYIDRAWTTASLDLEGWWGSMRDALAQAKAGGKVPTGAMKRDAADAQRAIRQMYGFLARQFGYKEDEFIALHMSSPTKFVESTKYLPTGSRYQLMKPEQVKAFYDHVLLDANDETIRRVSREARAVSGTLSEFDAEQMRIGETVAGMEGIRPLDTDALGKGIVLRRSPVEAEHIGQQVIKAMLDTNQGGHTLQLLWDYPDDFQAVSEGIAPYVAKDYQPRYLGSGAFASAFDIGEGRVLRIGDASDDAAYFRSKHTIQPLALGNEGQINWSVIPRAWWWKWSDVPGEVGTKAKIGWEQWSQLAKDIEIEGFKATDFHAGNIAYVDNRLVAVDPGSVRPPYIGSTLDLRAVGINGSPGTSGASLVHHIGADLDYDRVVEMAYNVMGPATMEAVVNAHRNTPSMFHMMAQQLPADVVWRMVRDTTEEGALYHVNRMRVDDAEAKNVLKKNLQVEATNQSAAGKAEDVARYKSLKSGTDYFTWFTKDFTDNNIPLVGKPNTGVNQLGEDFATGEPQHYYGWYDENGDLVAATAIKQGPSEDVVRKVPTTPGARLREVPLSPNAPHLTVNGIGVAIDQRGKGYYGKLADYIETTGKHKFSQITGRGAYDFPGSKAALKWLAKKDEESLSAAREAIASRLMAGYAYMMHTDDLEAFDSLAGLQGIIESMSGKRRAVNDAEGSFQAAWDMLDQSYLGGGEFAVPNWRQRQFLESLMPSKVRESDTIAPTMDTLRAHGWVDFQASRDIGRAQRNRGMTASGAVPAPYQIDTVSPELFATMRSDYQKWAAEANANALLNKTDWTAADMQALNVARYRMAINDGADIGGSLGALNQRSVAMNFELEPVPGFGMAQNSFPNQKFSLMKGTDAYMQYLEGMQQISADIGRWWSSVIGDITGAEVAHVSIGPGRHVVPTWVDAMADLRKGLEKDDLAHYDGLMGKFSDQLTPDDWDWLRRRGIEESDLEALKGMVEKQGEWEAYGSQVSIVLTGSEEAIENSVLATMSAFQRNEVMATSVVPIPVGGHILANQPGWSIHPVTDFILPKGVDEEAVARVIDQELFAKEWIGKDADPGRITYARPDGTRAIRALHKPDSAATDLAYPIPEHVAQKLEDMGVYVERTSARSFTHQIDVADTVERRTGLAKFLDEEGEFTDALGRKRKRANLDDFDWNERANYQAERQIDPALQELDRRGAIHAADALRNRYRGEAPARANLLYWEHLPELTEEWRARDVMLPPSIRGYHFQYGPRGVRAATHIDDKMNAAMFMLKNADVQSAIHEIFHAFAPHFEDSMVESLMTAYSKANGLRRRITQKSGRPQLSQAAEEWLAAEFEKYATTGEVVNPTLQSAFNLMGKLAKDGKGKKLAEAHPEVRGLFAKLLGQPNADLSAVPFDPDQWRMLSSARYLMGAAEDAAHKTQYFQRGRSLVERSVNHPYLGYYPASYMWGKVVPELVNFLVREPFGVKAPMWGYSMALHVSHGIQLQAATDPDFQEFLKKHPELIRFVMMMMPGTPWDIPVNAPAWARHTAETEMQNSVRESIGKKRVQPDLLKEVVDSANYAFGIGRSFTTVGNIFNESFGAPKDDGTTPSTPEWIRARANPQADIAAAQAELAPLPGIGVR